MKFLFMALTASIASFSAFSNPDIYSENVIGECSDAAALNEARVIQLNSQHIYIQFDKLNGISLDNLSSPLVYRMNSDHPYFNRASTGFNYETKTVSADDKLYLGGMTADKTQLAYPEEYANYEYRLGSRVINLNGETHRLWINLTDRIDMSRRSILGTGLYHANERRYRRSLTGATQEFNILDINIYKPTPEQETIVDTLMTCARSN